MISRRFLALSAIFFLATPSQALNISGSMQVSGTVAAACSISATAMAFGTLSTSTTTDSTATVSVTCSNSTLYDIGIGIGDHWDNQAVMRRMKSTTTNDLIPYALSSSATMTPAIGASAPNNFVDDAIGTGAVQTYTVYGRANSGTIPGSYVDALVVVLTY